MKRMAVGQSLDQDDSASSIVRVQAARRFGDDLKRSSVYTTKVRRQGPRFGGRPVVMDSRSTPRKSITITGATRPLSGEISSTEGHPFFCLIAVVKNRSPLFYSRHRKSNTSFGKPRSLR